MSGARLFNLTVTILMSVAEISVSLHKIDSTSASWMNMYCDYREWLVKGVVRSMKLTYHCLHHKDSLFPHVTDKFVDIDRLF